MRGQDYWGVPGSNLYILILLVLLRATSSGLADVRLREERERRTASARPAAILIRGNNQTDAGQLAETNGRSAGINNSGQMLLPGLSTTTGWANKTSIRP